MMKVGTHILHKTHPLNKIIRFFIVLLLSHFLWKCLVRGELTGHQVSVVGLDVSDIIYPLSEWTARAVGFLEYLLPRIGILSVKSTHLQYEGSSTTFSVIWGCNGIKQVYTFMCIMVFATGEIKQKMYYLLFGACVLTVFNLVRITLLVYFSHQHPGSFESLHIGLFRYMHYALLFLLWLVWEEKNKPQVQIKHNII